jgi:ribosome recycling factor
MFNSVLVEGNGSRTPIPELAQISVKGANRIAISVFDPAMTVLVANAIRESGLNLTPEMDGNTINITIPKPSLEARNELVKVAAKAVEKVSVKSINYIKYY